MFTYTRNVILAVITVAYLLTQATQPAPVYQFDVVVVLVAMVLLSGFIVWSVRFAPAPTAATVRHTPARFGVARRAPETGGWRIIIDNEGTVSMREKVNH